MSAPYWRLTSNWIATYFSIDFAHFLDDRTAVFSAEPNACSGDMCSSFYLVGGLLLVSPWPSKMTQLPEADSIILEREQILHIDFWEMSISNITVSQKDCRTWGGPAAALFFCIWNDQDRIHAGRPFISVLICNSLEWLCI